MPLESDQWKQKCPFSHPFNGKYELKCIHFIRNHCHCMENLKTIGFIAIGNDWDSYFEYPEFSTFATILDAILDFSICHQLYQFMLAVSDTSDRAEHFGI